MPRNTSGLILAELHVQPGVPHGFDLIAPEAHVTRRPWEERCRVLRSL